MNCNQFCVAALITFATIPGVVQGADFNVSETFQDTLRSGGIGPEMIVIRQGELVVGGGKPSEEGLGVVKIDYLLAVGTTEITNAQYRHFLEKSQSGNLNKFPKGNDNFPVVGITFDEAEAFVYWLSRQTGHNYRLPSATEWEYAARAGSSAAYSWGNKVGINKANCTDCGTEFSGAAAPVGSFPANTWGLHDMHGNVWEWTKDCIDSNMAPPPNGMPTLFGSCEIREIRGGSSKGDAWSIRASNRASALKTAQISDLRFRVVMDIPR
ncbi:MAG: formylglycine-generating enzyme family protein [Halioglobus sp.]